MWRFVVAVTLMCAVVAGYAHARAAEPSPELAYRQEVRAFLAAHAADGEAYITLLERHGDGESRAALLPEFAESLDASYAALLAFEAIEPPETFAASHALMREAYRLDHEGRVLVVAGIAGRDSAAMQEGTRLSERAGDLLGAAADVLVQELNQELN